MTVHEQAALAAEWFAKRCWARSEELYYRGAGLPGVHSARREADRASMFKMFALKARIAEAA